MLFLGRATGWPVPKQPTLNGGRGSFWKLFQLFWPGLYSRPHKKSHVGAGLKLGFTSKSTDDPVHTLPLLTCPFISLSCSSPAARLNIVYPMLFKLKNSKSERATHCGVLEFVADEGKMYLPYWVSWGTWYQFSMDQVLVEFDSGDGHGGQCHGYAMSLTHPQKYVF